MKKDNIPSPWAKDSVEWGINNGIILGDENGNYKLHENCTRQEMLIFLKRLYDLVNNHKNV